MTVSKALGLDWMNMARQIASALADLHRAVPPGDPAVPSVGIDWLQPTTLAVNAQYAAEPWKEFWRELHGLVATTDLVATGFIHRDFGVTHLLWHRARLEVSGILGWERAGYGPRDCDLARARLDLTLQCGRLEAADLFTRAYEVEFGERLGDRRFWDLAVGLSNVDALDSWQRNYAELGRSDLTHGILWIRLLEFLRLR